MLKKTKTLALAAAVAGALAAPAVASAALYEGAFNTGGVGTDGVVGTAAAPLTGFDAWNVASAAFFKVNPDGTETQVNPGVPGGVAPGDTIHAFYQGQVSAFNSLVGTLLTPNIAYTGHPGTYQVTAAADWFEKVNSVTPDLTTAVLVPNGGAKVSLFYDVAGGTLADVGLGTGFTDGKMFLQANVLPGLAGGITTYSIIAPGVGLGGGGIISNTTLALGNILLTGELLNPDFNGKTIHDFDISFTTQFGCPGCGASQTVNFFDNANGYVPKAVNPQLVLAADANSNITVPEPETMALLGIGLLGVALSRRRKLSV